MAQEAHEAIRPTKLSYNTADSEGDKKLTQNHNRLYKLIFDRAVATQMKEATIKYIKVQILGKKGYLFESDLQKVLFDGFLKILNPTYAAENQGSVTLIEDDLVKLKSLEPIASQTKPPPRYNEASLIKTLEEKGIGRPSTYAPIISLIQDKNYVQKESRVFIPSILGTAISDFLSASFPKVFDLNFTALLEEGLDKVADGSEKLVGLLKNFDEPFQKQLDTIKIEKKQIDVEEQIDEKCPKCESKLVIRFSRFGKFIACNGYPKCKFTKPFLQYVENKFCPKDKGKIVVRFTKTKKKFFGCINYPKCDFRSWKLNF
jgi:DNA topoisomerase-1